MKKPSLEQLTLREKIGQTVVFRHMLYGDIKPEDFGEYFRNNTVGFTWPMAHPKDCYKTSETLLGNPELLGSKDDMYIDLINLMNENMSVPVMPATDAANGIVPSKFEGHVLLPTAAGLGAANSTDLAYRYGKALGDDIRSIGFRWLWSPTADNTGVSFKDSRTLTVDVDRNCELLGAFIDGVHAAGVATCVKHFPGRDPYEYRDSHFCSSAYTLSYEHWEKTQGKEFLACIEAGADGIMISHRCFPAVDDTRVNGAMLPCTLSYKVITELIKGKLGYEGVILTDDCDMKGLTSIYQEEKLYVELLRAGNDVVLGPTRLDYVDIIERAVLSGDLPESRIDDACRRVLNMKEKYGIFDEGALVHPTKEEKARIDAELHKVAEDIAACGLSLAANRTGFVPMKKDIKRAAVFYIGYSDLCFENLKYMKDEFARYGVECDIKRGYQKSDEVGLEDYDVIIYATYIGFHAPLGGAAFYGAECRMLWDIMTKCVEKSVAVSFGDPNIFYNYFTAAPTFVNCYSVNKETMEGFVRGLFGDIKFTDFHPFPLNPVKGTNDVYGI